MFNQFEIGYGPGMKKYTSFKIRTSVKYKLQNWVPFCYMVIEALKICVIFQCLTRQLEDRKASAVFVLCTHSTSHYNRTANGIQSLRGNGFHYITASHTIENAHMAVFDGIHCF